MLSSDRLTMGLLLATVPETYSHPIATIKKGKLSVNHVLEKYLEDITALT
jgi:hypothetical protein